LLREQVASLTCLFFCFYPLLFNGGGVVWRCFGGNLIILIKNGMIEMIRSGALFKSEKRRTGELSPPASGLRPGHKDVLKGV
jgi:hypothetical protein